MITLGVHDSAAAEAGAALVKKQQRVSRGGHSGYFKNLLGHLCQIAHNPIFWEVPEDEKAP
jgi:hypothetical protein